MSLALAISLVSCKKDEEEPAATTGGSTQDSAQTYPTPGDADGVMVAVKAVTVTDTPIGPIETILGTAVSVFTDDGFASGDFITAGSVSCNGGELALNPNNSYTFTDISTTNPTGLDFNSDVQWEVSGGNGIPTISFNADVFGFPTVGQITSGDTVDKASGYTVSCASVSGADSVLFLVGGATKTLAGSATSCAFSASDLSDVDTGTNVVQVAAYVSNPTTFDTKKIYFINEFVQSQTVTVQ